MSPPAAMTDQASKTSTPSRPIQTITKAFNTIPPSPKITSIHLQPLLLPDDIRSSGESIQATNRAIARNNTRLQEKLIENQKLIGTYESKLFLQLSDCLPDPVHLPAPSRNDNPDMIQTILRILSVQPKPFQPPPFQFTMTAESAAFNSQVLRNHGYDLHRIITGSHTICSPGAEFRDPLVLEPLFAKHPLWPVTTDILLQGADLKFKRVPNEQQRLCENEALIGFHNHKKANELSDIIETSIATDVGYGFAVPINICEIQKIPGAMVCP
jgi:hypothetical protein